MYGAVIVSLLHSGHPLAIHSRDMAGSMYWMPPLFRSPSDQFHPHQPKPYATSTPATHLPLYHPPFDHHLHTTFVQHLCLFFKLYQAVFHNENAANPLLFFLPFCNIPVCVFSVSMAQRAYLEGSIEGGLENEYVRVLLGFPELFFSVGGALIAPCMMRRLRGNRIGSKMCGVSVRW